MQYTAQTAAKGWLSTSSIVALHPQVIRKRQGEGYYFIFNSNPSRNFASYMKCVYAITVSIYNSV